MPSLTLTSMGMVICPLEVTAAAVMGMPSPMIIAQLLTFCKEFVSY
jgi:hypothetical protein